MPTEPDEPRFGWLYGEDAGKQPTGPAAGGSAPHPADDQPEQTRVLRRTEHPYAAGAPPRKATPAPAATPPRKRRRFPIGKIVLLVLVAWIAFLVAVPVIAWKKVVQVDADPGAGRPLDQPGTTYLLVGSDSRKGLSEEERRKLTTGGDVGQRTDTIMLLHTGDGPSLLLSIPRDSIVPIPGHGTTKINAAFAYGGPKLLVKTIEENTGLRIDHYVEIGFGGFVNAVDAVGGVEICPNRRMVDPDAGLKISAGCQQADGVKALGYARSRKTDPALGDITRARHQREVVSAIGKKVKSPWTVLNPIRYRNLNEAAVSSLTVSEGTGPIDLARFAWAMTQVDGTNGLTCSMPIRDLAVHWDRERALALLRLIKADRTGDIPKNLCRPTGLAP